MLSSLIIDNEASYVENYDHPAHYHEAVALSDMRTYNNLNNLTRLALPHISGTSHCKY